MIERRRKDVRTTTNEAREIGSKEQNDRAQKKSLEIAEK